MKISQKIRYFLRSLRLTIKFTLINVKLLNGYKPNSNLKKLILVEVNGIETAGKT